MRLYLLTEEGEREVLETSRNLRNCWYSKEDLMKLERMYGPGFDFARKRLKLNNDLSHLSEGGLYDTYLVRSCLNEADDIKEKLKLREIDWGAVSKNVLKSIVCGVLTTLTIMGGMSFHPDFKPTYRDKKS